MIREHLYETVSYLIRGTGAQKMLRPIKLQSDDPHAMSYHVRVKGHLGNEWMIWFEHATITLEDNGNALLACTDMDQAALYSLLKKVRDLGLPLVSVNPIPTNYQKHTQPKGG